MKFTDIKQVNLARYAVDQGWADLRRTISRYVTEYKLDLDPEFQRGYIWTEVQKIQFVEWGLRGGFSGMDIFFNCPGWMHGFHRPMVLVDGKQRIDAVLAFLGNKIPAYGLLHSQYEGELSWTSPSFRFHVADLDDPKEVLEWYVALNTGGTQHTDTEIAKVKQMIKDLENKC
jgi:hypothetical protein